MKTLSLILLALGISTPLAAASDEASCAKVERVSVDSENITISGQSYAPSLSEDGRFVVFESSGHDVFLRDRTAGETMLVSRGCLSTPASSGGRSPFISGDGRWDFSTDNDCLDVRLAVGRFFQFSKIESPNHKMIEVSGRNNWRI